MCICQCAKSMQRHSQAKQNKHKVDFNRISVSWRTPIYKVDRVWHYMQIYRINLLVLSRTTFNWITAIKNNHIIIKLDMNSFVSFNWNVSIVVLRAATEIDGCPVWKASDINNSVQGSMFYRFCNACMSYILEQNIIEWRLYFFFCSNKRHI